MHFNEAFDPFRALASAWTLIRRAPAALLVGGLLFWVCELGQSGPGQGKIRVEDFDEFKQLDDVARHLAEAFLAGIGGVFLLFACVLGIAVWLFECLVRVGFASAVERAMVSGSDELGDLFKAQGRWGTMVLTTLVQAILQVLALLPGLALGGLAGAGVGVTTQSAGAGVAVGVVVGLCYLPVWMYVVLGLSLATFAVAVEGMSVTEAISRSWFLVRGHRWSLFLYWVVMALVELTFCCCCLLLFLPTTFSKVATYESYLRLVKSGDPSTWSTPPPTATDTPGA